MVTLPPRTKQIYEFQTAYLEKHGYPPLKSEISGHLKISADVIQLHLAKLETVGLIECSLNGWRKIRLTHERHSSDINTRRGAVAVLNRARLAVQ